MDRNRNIDSGNGSGSGGYLSKIGLEERHVQELRQTGHVATPHWQECKLIILRHTVSNLLQDKNRICTSFLIACLQPSELSCFIKCCLSCCSWPILSLSSSSLFDDWESEEGFFLKGRPRE